MSECLTALFAVSLLTTDQARCPVCVPLGIAVLSVFCSLDARNYDMG